MLKRLNPFIDDNGLLRVGGRLKESKLQFMEKFPLILPGKCHVAYLIVQHYHSLVKHQGRLFTEGAIRNAGLWIVGAKKLISSTIFKCIVCRRLRGSTQTQKMADFPADRLSTDPPFTSIGLDVFGPWSVVARHTRGGQANSKHWAILFTCMSISAIHIEVIESLDTSSFINALRRFIAIRGPIKHIRSDRGANFVGTAKELGILSNLNCKAIERFLSAQSCTWTFNPPHSSHMGGAWERMIGVVWRILDSTLLQAGITRLTHESLSTFLVEAVAIINARPLVPIANNPEEPIMLTPATLLTQKMAI
ncbi:zinc finger [Pristimantis euphronides]